MTTLQTRPRTTRITAPGDSGGLALVLSGGGAPAAYFGAGVALALRDVGLQPRVYSGVSAGALNAGALAAGITPEHLAEMWTSTRWTGMFRPRTDLWRLVDSRNLFRRPANPVDYLLGVIGWTWLLDISPARRTLQELLHGAAFTVPDDRVLIVTAVDENAGSVARFVNVLPPQDRLDDSFRQVGPTVDLLLSSAAVPLLFRPGSPTGGQNGRAYTDAGLIANTPLAPALAYRPEAALIVAGVGSPRPAPTPKSLADEFAVTVENVAHYALLADYEHAQTVNRLAEAAPHATDKSPVDMLLLEPPKLPFSMTDFLDFGPEQARRTIDYGRAQTRTALEQWPAAQRLKQRPAAV